MSPNPILKKLKLSEQNQVLIWNAPAEYQDTLKDVSAVIHKNPQQKYLFVPVFIKNKTETDKYPKQAVQ